jgi:hypothetical protein
MILFKIFSGFIHQGGVLPNALCDRPVKCNASSFDPNMVADMVLRPGNRS